MANYDNDNDPDEIEYNVCKKLQSAAEWMRTSMMARDKQKAYRLAHMIASSALEELDKLVVKESLTPMFGGE